MKRYAYLVLIVGLLTGACAKPPPDRLSGVPSPVGGRGITTPSPSRSPERTPSTSPSPPPGKKATALIGGMSLVLPKEWPVFKIGKDFHVLTVPCPNPKAKYWDSFCRGFWVFGAEALKGGFETPAYSPDRPFWPYDGEARCAQNSTMAQEPPQTALRQGYVDIGTGHRAHYREWNIGCYGSGGKVTERYVQRDWYLPQSKILVVDRWAIPELDKILSSAVWA